ncbi:ATP-binding protein [Xanthomonas sp. SHU 199]|uniref:ATP-binding protein n=1 Tax=Xanthomonas sp. SHU 199 TaxID=1591174 RepID=UPI00039ADE9A|nr:ATP-binding protein [Xanthomonas sp. SHU 199]
MSELVLETSFEEVRARFDESVAVEKFIEFVEPLPEVEAQISEIAGALKNSGKLVFILGQPGIGKSTFIQSLSWRPSLKVSGLHQIDASTFTSDLKLLGLYQELVRIGDVAEKVKDKGPAYVVINYLENLSEFEPEDIKGFFRRLNGLLRTRPLLLIWPVTQRDDVQLMRGHAADVSGTLFYRTKEVIDFPGPPTEKFVDIAKRTISVLNDGMELSDFSLTNDDLEEVFDEFKGLPEIQRTLREYLEMLKERWRKTTGYQEQIRSKIPTSTEVWFIFSYEDAESVVSQFVRRSQRIEDNWAAIHDKLFEYVHGNTQRSSVWNAKRLQIALYGALKTRILFLPTNTLVSCAAAYSESPALDAVLSGVPQPWRDKGDAKRTLSRTPLYKQLKGELSPQGKRKGGPAALAMREAAPHFESMVDWMVNDGGSDKVVNKAVAKALQELSGVEVSPDKSHPWIPNLVPDLFIQLAHKQICIEFHHTTKSEPGVIADYVLRKLNIYMNQLEQMLGKRI